MNTLPAINDQDWFSWDGIRRIEDACRNAALGEGLRGYELYFRSKDIFNELLDQKPTFRERQAQSRMVKTSLAVDPAIVALEQIAAGHNDPRSLAVEVLAAIKKERD